MPSQYRVTASSTEEGVQLRVRTEGGEDAASALLRSDGDAQHLEKLQVEPADPNTVKFEKDFQGLKIKVDRPKGFVMSGKDPEGKAWTRTYKYDYGYIPKTLGGDKDGLDVYLGPNKDAKDAYWVVQTKPDGAFDEYKVFLGFDSEEAAVAAYKAHTPAKLFHSVSAMSVEMMKALLGDKNPQEDLEKKAMWDGFVDELARIEG
jgi:hypothetical protein